MLHVELKVLEGRRQGTMIPLTDRQFLIGREQDCQLRPTSDLISRHHCVFTTDNNTVRLRDLGSTNGTFVNGERILGPVLLKPGDHVAIGKLSFEVVIRQSAELQAAAGRPVAAESSSIFSNSDSGLAAASLETSLNVSDTVKFREPRPGDATPLPTAPTPEEPAPPQATQTR